MLSAASSRYTPRHSGRRGCGRWPLATTKTVGRRTAMRRAAKPRWPRSPRAGGGSGRDESARVGRLGDLPRRRHQPRMPQMPNFTALDMSLPEVATLVAAVVRARDAVSKLVVVAPGRRMVGRRACGPARLQARAAHRSSSQASVLSARRRKARDRTCRLQRLPAADCTARPNPFCRVGFGSAAVSGYLATFLLVCDLLHRAERSGHDSMWQRTPGHADRAGAPGLRPDLGCWSLAVWYATASPTSTLIGQDVTQAIRV